MGTTRVGPWSMGDHGPLHARRGPLPADARHHHALAESGTPFSILTKGLLRRDLPLLVEASRTVDVSVAVSARSWSIPISSSGSEPGTPTPRARLDLVRAITARLECSVLAMPILPWLTDSEEQLDALYAALADAGASDVTTGALHLRPGAREWFLAWLGREYPALVPRYRRLYGTSSYAPADYRKWLGERFTGQARRRHGFARVATPSSSRHRTGLRKRYRCPDQPSPRAHRRHPRGRPVPRA
ncbi:hypothetical protein [Georgenia sp. SUBG003]|uniref:hypothetical protein n=1 Tax=Georgenia sp. SUBG003 TaxID=1497974 RepID=UPI003AB1B969